jgi:hypothetical protein
MIETIEFHIPIPVLIIVMVNLWMVSVPFRLLTPRPYVQSSAMLIIDLQSALFHPWTFIDP